MMIEKGYNVRSFAIVGCNDLGIQLARNVKKTPSLGLKLLGYYDDRPEERTATLPDDVEKQLGKIEDLIAAAKAGKVQVVSWLTRQRRSTLFPIYSYSNCSIRVGRTSKACPLSASLRIRCLVSMAS